MRRLRFLFEASLFGTLLAIGRVVPRGVLLALGTLAGDLGYLLDRRHRRIALDNLHAAFGDTLDRREARATLRRCWRHFGRISLDTLAFHRFDRSTVDVLVHYEGLEHLVDAWKRGRGVLVFAAHYGHWELAALMQGYLGMPLGLIARPLDNPMLEAQLARLRERSGNTVIHKRNAVRRSLAMLREGGAVAIVIDQDARDEGVFVPFFGRPASTTPTLALLALRTGATIVPNVSVALPDGSYRITYEPPVEAEPTGNRQEDVVRLTARCTSIVERWVRRHPEHWLWMHRRWKTGPPKPERDTP